MLQEEKCICVVYLLGTAMGKERAMTVTILGKMHITDGKMFSDQYSFAPAIGAPVHLRYQKGRSMS